MEDIAMLTPTIIKMILKFKYQLLEPKISHCSSNRSPAGSFLFPSSVILRFYRRISENQNSERKRMRFFIPLRYAPFRSEWQKEKKERGWDYSFHYASLRSVQNDRGGGTRSFTPLCSVQDDGGERKRTTEFGWLRKSASYPAAFLYFEWNSAVAGSDPATAE